MLAHNVGADLMDKGIVVGAITLGGHRPTLGTAWMGLPVLAMVVFVTLVLPFHPWDEHPPDSHSAQPHHIVAASTTVYAPQPIFGPAQEPAAPRSPISGESPAPLRGQFEPEPPQHPPR